MLDELCREVKNYFDKGQAKLFGNIEIVNGQITNSEFTSKIKLGQYFRIIGSVNNDGVYCFNEELPLEDETFNGAIWFMAIPTSFLALDKEIEKWKATNEQALKSPYQSESFGGYSYSKATGKNGAYSWQDAFAPQLNMYRRIRI